MNAPLLLPLDEEKGQLSTKDKTDTLQYVALYVNSKFDAQVLALGNTPANVNGAFRDKIDIKFFHGHGPRGGWANVSVKYKSPAALDGNGEEEPEDDPANPAITEDSVSFNIPGRSKFITHSLETISKTKHADETNDPPDFKQALNMVDGKPKGLEVNPQAFAESSYTVNMTVPTQLITNAFLANVKKAVNKVNNAGFRGSAVGEVLFAGLRGTYRTNEPESTFAAEFLIIDSVTNGTLGPFSAVNKKGWEYAWIYSEIRNDTTAKKRLEKPVGLYIERIFESEDLTITGVTA